MSQNHAHVIKTKDLSFIHNSESDVFEGERFRGMTSSYDPNTLNHH